MDDCIGPGEGVSGPTYCQEQEVASRGSGVLGQFRAGAGGTWKLRRLAKTGKFFKKRKKATCRALAGSQVSWAAWPLGWGTEGGSVLSLSTWTFPPTLSAGQFQRLSSSRAADTGRGTRCPVPEQVLTKQR